MASGLQTDSNYDKIALILKVCLNSVDGAFLNLIGVCVKILMMMIVDSLIMVSFGSNCHYPG